MLDNRQLVSNQGFTTYLLSDSGSKPPELGTCDLCGIKHFPSHNSEHPKSWLCSNWKPRRAQ